ncbi:TetR/AcrR family transcriptional regulator (plasmid) [Agrobacterium rosae]|uniref:TetR/AcrR family transcriptional regulator n=1 Tax=Agrobacterium rosae TaxID=1972867 RepID=A0AAW9FNR6_9HYPH|nr:MULTISPECIES: TetR/AcrR family transcriptional regulator [Agrobacterium]MDX8321681.1 TetR/AcrR family transcriptional regulator [Agrobacterium sp. rho-8.1]MDX8305143.1 TetR/AcrR family transcriptional regulator [Agrobacterium rosae]MDX8311426.1 TetR/AcrR family transcriptional regulator [Agrobacterium sp. rho-13.3]MDX8316341.1 TetR/AcrR family transcriptional regulator [Agrobacterium rosae]MDX8332352.1 TetR/AcrR family transcriptional regulator [Agrobacterium rosae]
MMGLMTSGVKSETERQILAAASELLETKGEKGLTARAVCQVVNVKQPTLYHYFGSKDGLLHALVADGITDFIAFKRTCGDVADPIEGLMLGWHAFLDYSALHPQLMKMIHRTVSQCPDATASAMATARQKLGRLEREGRLQIEVDIAIDMLLLVAHGTLALWTQGKPLTSVRESATRSFEAVLSAIIRDYRSPPENHARLEVLEGA